MKNVVRRNVKSARKVVVGVSTSNRHLSSVRTTRSVDIFVSRLNPHTVVTELSDCVHEVKGDIGVLDINCTKLKSRYEHLYSSFYVSVRVDSLDLKKAIDVFLSDKAWPEGVLVRRYFIRKDGQHES